MPPGFQLQADVTASMVERAGIDSALTWNDSVSIIQVIRSSLSSFHRGCSLEKRKHSDKGHWRGQMLRYVIAGTVIFFAGAFRDQLRSNNWGYCSGRDTRTGASGTEGAD
jgi:hypothetical protein